MVESAPLRDVYYSTEPHVPVVGGPFHRGYARCLAGDLKGGREIILDFLASVYCSRETETSTLRYVREIYRENGMPLPTDRAGADPAIVRAAAARRFDRLHWPLLESIRRHGYLENQNFPITLIRQTDRLLVCDGKNRSSILAALGAEIIPEVRFL